MAFHPPSQLDNWTFRRAVWATLVVVFVGLSFWLLYRFYQIITCVRLVTGKSIMRSLGTNWNFRNDNSQ
jgi:hypothetical protein